MNNMNWDDFRYFLAAAEAGSFSAAAKKLHSNQPTVRRHIGALEKSLGKILFQRRIQGLTLTAEGLSILSQCQRMQSNIIAINRTLGSKENNNKGIVRLAVPEGICSKLLIPHLAAFYERYPDIKLILQVSSKTANLTRGEADIAIRLFRPQKADLVIKKIADMAMSLYASDAYISTHGQLPSVQAFKNHRFIAYGDDLHNLPENQWLTDNVGLENIVLQTDSTLCRLKATEESVGFSIQPDLLAGKSDRLIKATADTSIPPHQVWLAYHNDLRHLDRVRSVIALIIDVFAARP